MRATAFAALLGVAAPAGLSARALAADPAPADPLVRFKELSAKAEAAYQARQYQSAIDIYLEAYGVLASADVLYNIAYIYDHHLTKRDLAQDFYRRVIRMPESSKEIMELSVKRLAELEAAANTNVNVLKPGEPTPAPAPTPAPGTPGVDQSLRRDDPGPGVAPWVMVGIGGAAVIGGVVMGLAAQGTNDDFHAETDLDVKRTLEDDGRGQALWADILGFGGGALVAGGLIWYFVASGSEQAPASSVQLELPPLRPLLTRDGIGLAWGGKL